MSIVSKFVLRVLSVLHVGKVVSLVLLLLPAWVAVQSAILFADFLYEPLGRLLKPILGVVNTLPAPLNYVLGLDYGILSMFPFLVLYALPTVFLFAIIFSLYRTSGVIERLAVSLNSLVTPLGVTGRDLVHIIMGLGCNVPAVISTRQCTPFSRGNCISAISFGAACSYQLPAIIAIFAAAKMGYLIIPYIVILALTTVLYLWVTASKDIAKLHALTVAGNRKALQTPSFQSVVSEVAGLVKEFLTVALPIFMTICCIAGVLDWIGFMQSVSWLLSPVMALFNLPAEAATSVVLGSIRKDGIAIGLLTSSWDSLKVPITSPVQLLTVVYMAGCFLPCIVTLFTVAREMHVKFAVALCVRQMTAVVFFSLLIAWGGYALF